MQKGLFTSQPANVWLWSAPNSFKSSQLLLKAITDNQVFPSVLWDSNLMQEPNLSKHRREKANPEQNDFFWLQIQHRQKLGWGSLLNIYLHYFCRYPSATPSDKLRVFTGLEQPSGTTCPQTSKVYPTMTSITARRKLQRRQQVVESFPQRLSRERPKAGISRKPSKSCLNEL